MNQIILSTTGTTGSIIINDLFATKFIHPSTNLILADVINQYNYPFTVEQLKYSTDLQNAVTNGYITLKDETSGSITNIYTSAKSLIDESVKISSTDTTTDYLYNKLSNTGDIQIIKLNSGNNESVKLNVSSSWIGNTNITTLGTITTGVWSATPIVWTKVDKTGSNITDLVTRSHASLTSLDYASAGHTGFQPSGSYLTSLSIASSNGFSGISSGGLTPIITLASSITGILKGNGTSILSASSGVDYEPALTFSTGLTRSVNTITSNISTGVAGGQTIYGGTLASNNLTIQSTTNATKGNIILGTSYYDEVNNRLGIGVTTPLASLHLKAGTATANTAPLKFNSGTVLTTPESGAIEYDNIHLYYTDNIPVRQIIVASAFGDMYENTIAGTTILTLTAGNGFTAGWVTATAGSNQLTQFVNTTPADQIQILSGGSGNYFVSFYAAVAVGANRQYKMCIAKNGNPLTNLIRYYRSAAIGATTQLTISISGIIPNLAVDDTIDVRFGGTNNNDSITLYAANLSIHRI